ncbi:3-deoxy-D-manno-octulosonic acid transferase [Shimia sp. SK013]|uniref:3-deoxy-D-manno-octulosonic acid transferase n=1 Tax=Shimia sp. SK013 TaxID=1389006 RepID=UPI0006B5200F|nr:glycosyltransferase N-terminal domain-containing protein [Shimia sp. SK013]KPA21205.1 3-deoxy-D-manno-octulosonic acid transferase [Shimia sp. SK013]
MPRSLGLTAYLAFARRQPRRFKPSTTERPKGELIWLHCSDPARVRSLAQLGLRLAHLRDDTQKVLITTAGDALPAHSLPAGAIWQKCPGENPEDIRDFLEYWQPELLIWLGKWLRPALIVASSERMPAMLLEPGSPMLENKRWRVGPEPIRATLARFSIILANTPAGESRLRSMLPENVQVRASGELTEEAPALSCVVSDLEDLRETLAGRPVWLAARVQPEEMPAVLTAYRAALRLSHRLLLVVVPDSPTQVAAIDRQITDQEWRVAYWDDGVFPQRDTQVVLAESAHELGLWYRIAPVSFVGSSLVSGHGGRDPLEPAALGSAVLYGPSVRNHLDSYTRLANAGAARIVRDADSLATALIQLAAPDQLATMAHAGWQEISQTAEVTDTIVAHAQRLLDEQEAAP